jgi:hypothetical protein
MTLALVKSYIHILAFLGVGPPGVTGLGIENYALPERSEGKQPARTHEPTWHTPKTAGGDKTHVDSLF